MKELSMKIINAHAAGIDVGSRSHLVAVDQEPDHLPAFHSVILLLPLRKGEKLVKIFNNGAV